MIREDYVSFKLALLLEKKGFDERCHKKYNSSGDLFDAKEFTYGPKAPTLQMAMKWLREVHNIFISIDIYSKDLEGNIRYCVEIYKYGSRMILDTPIICNTYEESSDLAIKYCLINLI